MSIGTISKYLNHKPIQEKNRLLIEDSIHRLNYIPNKTAQHLRSKSSNSVCILIPDIGNYIWGETCNAILSFFKNNNYSVIIRSYSTDDNYTQDIQFLLTRQIDGVILFADISYPSNLLELISQSNIPFVCMNQKPNNNSDFICTSYAETSYLATKHLMLRGHKKMGILGLDSYSGREGLAGFEAAIRDSSLDPNNQFMFLYTDKSALDKEPLNSVLSSSHGITSLILLDHVTTLSIALDFMPKYTEHFQTLSVIALGDDEILRAINPPYTVFSEDFQNLGQSAGRLLLKRMSGDYSDYPTAISCPSVFIERKSVYTLL